MPPLTRPDSRQQVIPLALGPCAQQWRGAVLARHAPHCGTAGHMGQPVCRGWECRHPLYPHPVAPISLPGVLHTPAPSACTAVPHTLCVHNLQAPCCHVRAILALPRIAQGLPWQLHTLLNWVHSLQVPMNTGGHRIVHVAGLRAMHVHSVEWCAARTPVCAAQNCGSPSSKCSLCCQHTGGAAAAVVSVWCVAHVECRPRVVTTLVTTVQ